MECVSLHVEDSARASAGDVRDGVLATAQLACPICGSVETVKPLANFCNVVLHAAFNSVDLTDWYYCACECLFQPYGNIDLTCYDDAYHAKYNDARQVVTNQGMFFLIKAMALTQGRSLLDVGDSQDHLAGVAVTLGWFPTMLDINPRVNDCHFPAICGDFEAYDLGDKRYDCIWASHVFEHFRDPKAALVKCYNLLNDNGVLYVAAPDLFYLMRRYPWGHLHRKEHHIMFSMASFRRLAELVGFKTIYTGRMNQRGIFSSWHDYHLVFHREGGQVVLAQSLN